MNGRTSIPVSKKQQPGALHGQGVRPMKEEDIPEVARLLTKMFPRSAGVSVESKCEILRKLEFENPLKGEEMSSLVYSTTDDRITGFLGVTPRLMSINGRSVKVAVSYNFMVDADSRAGMAGIKLLKEFLAGPQDVSIADAAVDTSREIWERLGGKTIYLYSTYWKCPLRPSGFARHYLGKRKGLKFLMAAAKPVCRVIDGMVTRFPGTPFSQQQPEGVRKDLSVEQLANAIEEFSKGKSLAPDYRVDTLSWILTVAEQAKRFGKLKKTAVFDKHGEELLGWFIYYKNPGGTSEVLQLQARPRAMARVVDHLLFEAWKQGAVEVAGRLEPSLIKPMSRKFCLYTPGRMWMLVHTKESAIVRALEKGDAFISRLEGDLWLL